MEEQGHNRALASVLIYFAIATTFLTMGTIATADVNGECTTTTCYKIPEWVPINSTIVQAAGICTTSATYVIADGFPSGSLPIVFNGNPQNPQSTASAYSLYDFDVSVTVLGTTGKISVYSGGTNGFGVGFPISREMTISNTLAANLEESGALQGSGLSFGLPLPAGTLSFGLEIMRTGGTGSVCLSDFEGIGYMLAAGGTPL